MASVNGSAGIDDCSAGPGSCHANGCAGTCTNNAYQMAYPNFGDCISDHHCSANTGVPYAGAHQCGNYNIEVYQKSCSNTSTFPQLKDCGPPARQASGGYCVSQRQAVVACLNSSAFSALCNGCNPATYGLIGANFITS